MIKQIVVFLIFLVLSGCTTTLTTISRIEPEQKRIVKENNYIIGVRKVATIGSPIIEKVSYTANVLANASVRPDRDSTLNVVLCFPAAEPHCRHFIPADRNYDVIKKIEYKGKEYFVVSSENSKASSIDPYIYPSPYAFHFLIDQEGNVLPVMFVLPATITSNGLKVNPVDVKFKFQDRIRIQSDNYTNERIVLAGADANS